MPDWSYHTFVRHVFERLPDDFARRFSVGLLGRMAALPQGFRVVDALGHMAPDASLGGTVAGVEFSSPLGLAPVIDPEGRAVDAFSRFGFGFLVVGPVGLDEPDEPPRFARDDRSHGIVATGTHALGLERAREVSIRTPGSTRLAFELALPGGPAQESIEAGRRLIEGLGGRGDLLLLSPRTLDSLDGDSRREVLTRLVVSAREAGLPLFVGLPVTVDADSDDLTAVLDTSSAGLYLSGRPGATSSEWSWGERDAELAIDLLKSIREKNRDAPIIVDACVLSPRQAIELDEAGADLILLGAGVVHTGPGLPKRVNEALEHHRKTDTDRDSPPLPPERRAWFWGAALGAAMFVGAILAAWIALTSVLLPYDEAFLGKTRDQIEAFNPRIVHFMTHDRITLAGTMVSISVLYLALSLFGMRRGHHWAQRIVSVSAGLGFLTFFGFLGFGFFDPFHAFVTLALLQLFIQVIVRPLGAQRRFDAPPPLDNDRAWKMSQWGQLLFVVQAVGLLAGGSTILFFGMTSVYVPEDIEFLQMESTAIEAFDPELTPLIAHDRATFGGMLVAAGIALLLTTLWSFRRGDRWLWWTYLATILPPYAMTLWIHGHIGYTNHFHLSPVYIGLALLAGGLALSAPHLLGGHGAKRDTR